ncbi:MAG: hypothetical protein JSW61_00830 [Candidatus Thorarchaeota archaeon]|nr:MAG: hypothetical protein JSW61_00830 [Candidatus Thorarchaeota archaeon]
MTSDSAPDATPAQPNKYQVGPGIGLLLMGIMYLVFWLSPLTFEAFTTDPRWSHNWVYALIIITIGASFYQKSVGSRFIAMVQGLLMPLTASGAFSTTLMTMAALFFLSLWIVVFLFERNRSTLLLHQRLSQRTQNWIVMHSLIVCWILLAHMGLVFFFGRLPFEAQLDTIGTSLGESIGFLINLPIERYDLVTYVFDINLTILAVLFGYEQFKVGYNLRNRPWPRISFWFLWITIILGLVLLPINLEGIVP